MPKFLCTLIENIRTLFEYRAIIAELRAQLVQQKEYTLAMFEKYDPEGVKAPLPPERASKENAPVRFKRSSYAEAMSSWEYEHNTKLKTELEKRRGGFY